MAIVYTLLPAHLLGGLLELVLLSEPPPASLAASEGSCGSHACGCEPGQAGRDGCCCSPAGSRSQAAKPVDSPRRGVAYLQLLRCKGLGQDGLIAPSDQLAPTRFSFALPVGAVITTYPGAPAKVLHAACADVPEGVPKA